MKKFLLAGVATVALVAAANAADQSRPVYKAAPAVAPMPVFSWTGCYIGGHGGWGWGREHTTQHSINSSGIITRTNVGDINTEGAIFGGQIGCDYQFAGAWLIGIEGDFAGTRLTGDIQDPHGTEIQDVIRAETKSLASVTARLGLTGWLPQTLVYVKGGGAWIHNRYDFRNLDREALRGDFGENFSGWTIGGGVEYAITPNWSVFTEFNYYNFDSERLVNSRTFGGGTFTENILVKGPTIETVKLGVNYRFNWPLGKSPVVARY